MRKAILLQVGALCWCTVALAQVKAVTLHDSALLKGPAGGVVAKTTPSIDVCLIPDLPPTTQCLWSSWGDGCIASNGKYYLAVGNHLDEPKAPGLTRIYEYDPKAKSLKLLINVPDIPHDEHLAVGKIHARMDQCKDGWIYFATYWGVVPKDATWKAGFKGSGLFRFNPLDGKAEYLGVPIPGQGLPTSLTDPERMMMYGYAVYSGDFVAYDLAARQLKFRGGGDTQGGSRNIMLDAQGTPYFTNKDGLLVKYDSASNTLIPTKARLPAPASEGKHASSILRASTCAGVNGLIYGMTQAGVLFSFDPKTQKIENLGPNVGGGEYTTVMVLSPDNRFVYYAPGAHGSGARIGSPIVQYDVASKKHKIIAYLNPILRDKLKYNIGGTYNMKVSADGSMLLCTFNGGMLGGKKVLAFGQPSVVILHIPADER